MGWASPGKVVEAVFTATDNFAERKKDSFMGNLQYIAYCLPLRLSPRSTLLRMLALVFAAGVNDLNHFLSVGYRQTAFPAFGIARNVRLAGGNVTCPDDCKPCQ
jgi:hypothetical protein